MFDYEVENGILKIFLCGEVDHHHAAEIRTCVDELIDRFLPKTVILDFEHVSFCDSSGIAIVLGRYKKMQSLGSDLFLSGKNLTGGKINGSTKSNGSIFPQ